MRVGSGHPYAGTQSVSSTQKERKTKGQGQTSSSSSSASTQDAASIMGVPEHELTPNVQRALLTLMGEVDQMRRETEALRQRIRDLETLADHDVLLPVLNRRAFIREVSKALALAERHDAPSALIYFDLNGFKAINDTHGHAAGDAALHAVSDVLTAHLRETDAVGRLGGDEFAVVLTLTPQQAAERKAEELADIIASTTIAHEGIEFSLKTAWGVHALTKGATVETALAQADAAMYARKQAAA